VAGGDRGVGGEDALLTHRVFVAVEFLEERQGQKDRVSFIHVIGCDATFQAL